MNIGAARMHGKKARVKIEPETVATLLVRRLRQAVAKMQELRGRFHEVKVSDAGKVFNTELMQAWELGNMLDLALVTAQCALASSAVPASLRHQAQGRFCNGR